MKTNFTDKFYLSTDCYYFKYRADKNDSKVTRATLYNLKDEKIDDVRVSEGYGVPEKSHYQVINYFESIIDKQFQIQNKISKGAELIAIERKTPKQIHITAKKQF